MTEATQTAPNDAREASKSRVQTQDTVLSTLTSQEAAKQPPESHKPTEEGQDGGEAKPKKTASERIQELAGKRKEAEARADAAERRAAELEARVQDLSARPAPLEDKPRPLRSQFASEEDYTEALSDWKTDKRIAEREAEAAKARVEAEEARIAGEWGKRQEQVMKTLPDYAEVIGKSELSIPAHVHRAILESDQGPQIAYYLALHPEEAKRVAEMSPIKAIKRIAALERDLLEIEDAPVIEDKEPPNKSKAPPPIEPVRSVPSSSTAPTSDYEEYKRRRLLKK